MNLPAMKSNVRPLPVSTRPVRRRANRRAAAPVVAQVRAAFARGSRLATLVGCVLGGFVPLASYVLAHLPSPSTALWGLVVGGLLFSAKTVWQWGLLAFADPWKASGFCLLIEGVMVLSPVPWLGLIALGILISVNAIATGCTLAKGAE